MSPLRSLVVSLSLLAVAGCSASPLPLARENLSRQDFTQEFLRGAQHWKILARETVDDVLACVEGHVVLNEETERYEPVCAQDTAGLAGRSFFVELVDTATPFGRAFHEFLTTALVQRGQTVSHSAEGALIVRSRMRFVSREGSVPVHSVPGSYALLGTGIWALEDTSLVRMLALGTLADAYIVANDGGGAQIIVTTSLMDEDRFVMRRSNGYFIENADFAHYASNAPAADLKVPPKVSNTPPPSRTFNVVGE
jgi:hypothetical protein